MRGLSCTTIYNYQEEKKEISTCFMSEAHNQKKRKLDSDDENHVEDKGDVPSGKCEVAILALL